MFQLSCGLGRGGKPAAPVTLIAVGQEKIMERPKLNIQPDEDHGTVTINAKKGVLLWTMHWIGC